MKLLILPGDGIGPEITAATLNVLRACSEHHSLNLEFVGDVVGHESLSLYGSTVRPEVLAKAESADGIVLGPTATFDFKDEARGEVNPSKFFRKKLDLFANIRPSRTYEGYPGPVGAFDGEINGNHTDHCFAWNRCGGRRTAELVAGGDKHLRSQVTAHSAGKSLAAFSG